MSMLLLGGGLPRIPLIRPGLISPRLSFARAQTGGVMSGNLGADDATWSEVAADVPRFYGSARRLRIEGQRTNSIRNPRGEGAGSAPTYWSSGGAGSGVTITRGSDTTITGLSASTWRIAGTASASLNVFIRFDTTSASLSQIWTQCQSVQIVADSVAAGVVCSTSVIERDAGSAFLTQGLTTFVPSATVTRPSGTRTLSNASVAQVQGGINIAIPNGTTVGFTLAIAAPQLELGAFASTPILPAVGTPAASTRGADLVSASLASLGIPANGACTVLMTCMLPQAAPSGAGQAIVCFDDGTSNNRFLLQNFAGGSGIYGARTLGGLAANVLAGTMTLSAAFAVGMTVDGTGRLAISYGGAAVVSVTGGPVSGLTIARIGNTATGASALSGDITYLDIIRAPVSDARLQAEVAAMPIWETT